MQRLSAFFLAASISLAPLAGAAQEGPPSYAEPDFEGVQRIEGHVASFDGGYRLTVRDERGYVDRVRIHPGTIINPTGITLEPGMVVSIIGENEGSYFSGDEIDTPYTFVNGVPCYRDHAWDYYGAGFALGFFFASSGWWHGGYFHGYPYGWNRGYRVYRVPGRAYGGWYGGGHGSGYRGPLGRSAEGGHWGGGHSGHEGHGH